jgi:hypothetical protein
MASFLQVRLGLFDLFFIQLIEWYIMIERCSTVGFMTRMYKPLTSLFEQPVVLCNAYCTTPLI